MDGHSPVSQGNGLYLKRKTANLEPVNMQRPAIGIGIIIENQHKQVLIGKRKGSHAPYFSIPGGHLELGESFEQAAIREVAEETGLHIQNPEVIGVTNNLATFKAENYHSVSIILVVKDVSGTAKLLEPHKCEGWFWVDPLSLPQPHFDASESAINNYLANSIYRKAL
jgi:ADP-ribose pyrophosphatase YjhB (NUDIX family)